MLKHLPPLALYAHFPWCVRKCPYCDFNSHRAPAEIPQNAYVDTMLDDLRHDLRGAEARALTSIFLGGGTPSLFGPEAIHRLLAGVRQLVPCEPDMEVSMEANPGTIEHGRFSEYRAAGINRVSLGVQSFDDRQLQQLGRIHTGAEVGLAVDELARAGIANFNLDLMYGLPVQDVAAACADIDQAMALSPAHISHYQLTLEPGTAFFHRPPTLPVDDDIWDMQCACQERLARAGYEQYEISAYAQPGRRCVHNLNYWTFGDYIGIGAGAHGKLTTAAGVLRTERRKQPRDYLERMQAADRILTAKPVPETELGFEFMLNALRLPGGFDRSLFERRAGIDWACVEPMLAAARERQLMQETANAHWSPTMIGQRFLSDLQALFLP